MNTKIVNTLTLKDDDYPEVLRFLNEAPTPLYWLGTHPQDWLNRPRVAIVGSRKVTPYGRSVTDKLSKELAGYGVVIISGLALGVDSIAHQAALDAGGLTIAVLPTSLDNIYPASHLNLATQIVKQKGTLISEYSSTAQIYRTNFIIRNRIVSGLAEVLLITEAAVNSGTLHTARFALEQGKTVMVVPGNITSPGSEGCNNLIKSGAVPVTDVTDILFALKIQPKRRKIRLKNHSSAEKLILRLLEDGLESQEDLALASKMDAATLGSTLTMLEIAGAVRPQGAGHWSVA